jgi:hypothetical protein
LTGFCFFINVIYVGFELFHFPVDFGTLRKVAFYFSGYRYPTYEHRSDSQSNAEPLPFETEEKEDWNIRGYELSACCQS